VTSPAPGMGKSSQERVGEVLPGHPADAHLAGGQVAQRQPHGALAGGVARQRGQEVVAARLQQAVAEHGAGGDHLGDRAANQALGQGGVLHLVADGHAAAGGHQAAQVGLQRVRGDAGERGLAAAVVARGEREVEELRPFHRVVVEVLVEVADAEEDERVRVARLHLAPLQHQRSVFGRHRRGRRGARREPGANDVWTCGRGRNVPGYGAGGNPPRQRSRRRVRAWHRDRGRESLPGP
jgi:hypothetical protein